MNNNPQLTYPQAMCYDLVDYLSGLGFQPCKIVRNQYWYFSPFEPGNEPTFKVNRLLNRWQDFSQRKEGDLVDFAINYHRCTIGEFLRILETKPSAFCSKAFIDPATGNTQRSQITILRYSTLTDPCLLAYLGQRRIPLAIADRYCKQVLFELNGAALSAIGQQNDSGGWELGSSVFQGNCPPAAFTSIVCGGEVNVLCVFTHYFDFLSFLTLIPEIDRQGYDYLVLHREVFFEQARVLMESYTQVQLYLDNSPSGRIITNYALGISHCYRDQSHFYAGYHSLNAKLVFWGQPSP